MSDYQKARLAARVKGTNGIHRIANELYPQLRKALEPFIGQKVITGDGNLFVKVKKALPPLPNGNRLHCYLDTSGGYTLGWHFKTWERVPTSDGCGHAIYSECSLYLGSLRDGILTELNSREASDLRDNYDAEQIDSAREHYRKLQALADSAKSELFPFGEYDR